MSSIASRPWREPKPPRSSGLGTSLEARVSDAYGLLRQLPPRRACADAGPCRTQSRASALEALARRASRAPAHFERRRQRRPPVDAAARAVSDRGAGGCPRAVVHTRTLPPLS